jgi:putative tryptophan/tyrosine transport system substrate-binding protein
MRVIGLAVIVALGLFAALLAGEAQQPTRVHRIGYLLGTTREQEPFLETFLEAMRALGYVEGQNLVMEYRAAKGQYERFPAFAAELVRLKVDVLLVVITSAALAAKDATTTIPIPIVMLGVGDPVGSGLVASLARPGGNVTGVTSLSVDLMGKQLELLKAMLPTLSRVAILWEPANLAHVLRVREADMAAQRLGVQLHRVEARGPEAFDRAFADMTRAHAGALLVLGGNIAYEHRRRLAELAATSRLPTMHNVRPFVEAGGLMAYGPTSRDLRRRAAVYVDKILKGAKPADLPVEQPTKFELVINLKTAKTLGLTIPQSILVRADELIQ